jgi:ParB-like chromosome segregation protein Spo0J
MTKEKAHIEIANREVEDVDISTLIEHPQNPRRGNVGVVLESMKENGFFGTIVAQRSTRRILAGNHRFKAAKAAGMKTLPVAWVDVDDERATKILLADNRTSDLATYDEAVLSSMLKELADGIGLVGTGYGEEDLNDLIRKISGDADTGQQIGHLEYRVVVDCDSEGQQAELLAKLESEGYSCRALIS